MYRTITVAIVHSIYSQSVRESARGQRRWAVLYNNCDHEAKLIIRNRIASIKTGERKEQ